MENSNNDFKARRKVYDLCSFSTVERKDMNFLSFLVFVVFRHLMIVLPAKLLKTDQKCKGWDFLTFQF